MKHSTSTLMLLFGLGLLSLNSSDVAAQPRTPDAVIVVADTGVVTLGPDQLLRVTAVNGGGGQGTVSVRFKETTYSAGACNGPVCIHPVASQNTYGLLTLTGGAAASLEILNTAHGVRGLVSSDSPNLKVLAEIVDATTGMVLSFAPPNPGPYPCP